MINTYDVIMAHNRHKKSIINNSCTNFVVLCNLNKGIFVVALVVVVVGIGIQKTYTVMINKRPVYAYNL